VLPEAALNDPVEKIFFIYVKKSAIFVPSDGVEKKGSACIKLL
jgi:hypothetical protein